MDETARLQRRRDAALGAVAGGLGMIFLGSWNTSLAFGGVAMVLAGAPLALFWSARLRKARGDPWAYDPELDGPDPRKPREPDWNRPDQPDQE
ncbi:MAG: hypothetical protein QOD77_101 [Thermoplasmata archaeon]|nr:hypothetical protein [Thermoplasmata archaeon]